MADTSRADTDASVVKEMASHPPRHSSINGGLLTVVATALPGNAAALAHVKESTLRCGVPQCRCSGWHGLEATREQQPVCETCGHGAMYHVRPPQLAEGGGSSSATAMGGVSAQTAASVLEFQRIESQVDSLERRADLKLARALAAPSGSREREGKTKEALGALVGALDLLSAWREHHPASVSSRERIPDVLPRMQALVGRCEDLRRRAERAVAGEPYEGGEGLLPPSARKMLPDILDFAVVPDTMMSRPFDIDESPVGSTLDPGRRRRKGPSNREDLVPPESGSATGRSVSGGPSNASSRSSSTRSAPQPCHECCELVAVGVFCQSCGARQQQGQPPGIHRYPGVASARSIR